MISLILIFSILLVTANQNLLGTGSLILNPPEIWTNSRNQLSCSIFTVEFNNTVYFGNNEDEGGNRQHSNIWFEPVIDNNTYGMVGFCFSGNPPGVDEIGGRTLGGMNTQGLCFDGNGLPALYKEIEPNKTVFAEYTGDWPKAILRECKSVKEVIIWFNNHDMGARWWYSQAHFADATGDAVVVTLNENHEFSFIRKNDSNFLVSTNWNLAYPENNYEYPCNRYDTVTAMLNESINQENVTIESLRNILEAVHFPSTPQYVGTMYSNIFNPVTQEIWLWPQHDYSSTVRFNLTEELNLGYHEYRVADLRSPLPDVPNDETEFLTLEVRAILLIAIYIGIGYTVWYGIRRIRDRLEPA